MTGRVDNYDLLRVMARDEVDVFAVLDELNSFIRRHDECSDNVQLRFSELDFPLDSWCHGPVVCLSCG